MLWRGDLSPDRMHLQLSLTLTVLLETKLFELVIGGKMCVDILEVKVVGTAGSCRYESDQGSVGFVLLKSSFGKNYLLETSV